MPAAALRFSASLAAFVVAVLGLSAAAQARHGRHHHHQWQDYYGEAHAFRPDAGGAPTQPEAGGFAALTAAMIRACREQAAELQRVPIDAVLKTVQPSDAQRAALEQIRTAATDAANTLTGSCPKNVPAKLTDRLDTTRASLDAIQAALSQLRPAFVSAYAALDDEQKARLVVWSISKPSSPQPQSAATAAAPAPAPGADYQAQPMSLDCRQWPALLKTWPLDRIEAELSLSDAQQAALYTLMGTDYGAAATLAASCHDENAFTPLARLDAELGRVDVLHRSIDTIAPVLAGFINALNDEQNAHLNSMLGVAPQPVTTAR